jgi:hypothetical protein
MSSDEFDLFLTYLYLFGNKHVKYKLSFFFFGFPNDLAWPTAWSRAMQITTFVILALTMSDGVTWE